MQWSSTSQETVANGIKVLTYSDSGAGKTMLCATAPKPIILSAEAGLLSLRKANIERVFGAGRKDICYEIPVLKITTLAELSEAYGMFLRGDNRIREHCHTICLDSLTEMAEKMLSNIKATTKDGRQAFGEFVEHMTVLVKNFRDLPGYHCYMSSKMEYAKDEATGGMKFTASMPGNKLGPQLPYLFDEVFRLGRGETQGKRYRFLQTDGDDRYVAKDRSGSLELMEEPHLGKVFHKILGE
jgi:hypothetical protein